MLNWLIRPAVAADLPLLGPLEDRAGLRFRESVHPYCADFSSFDAGHLAELVGAGTVWVAVGADDTPIGFAIAEARGGEGYLHELDVDVAHGRRGVGRALVRRVAEWARSTGFETLLLSTFRDVPWNAPYYERLGFQIVPLDVYDDAMRAQRQSDAAAGMRLESRVMMRAALGRLLA
jgi:GNAT superfamily N-acetyltransferase